MLCSAALSTFRPSVVQSTMLPLPWCTTCCSAGDLELASPQMQQGLHVKQVSCSCLAADLAHAGLLSQSTAGHLQQAGLPCPPASNVWCSGRAPGLTVCVHKHTDRWGAPL